MYTYKNSKYNYDVEKILKYHEEGYNTYQITEMLGLPKHCYKTICKILKDNGKQLRGGRLIIPPKIIESVCKDYIDGMTQLEILNKYKEYFNNEGTVHQILKRNNIEFRNTGTRSSITNHDYFEVINTEEKAYFLGLLMADGCITCNKNKEYKIITISLKAEDGYLIKAFGDTVGFTGKYSEYDKDELQVMKKWAKDGSVRISFTSQKMAEDLIKYGIIPNKTGKEYISENIPEEFLGHFLRGCFDGDGSIFQNKRDMKYRIAYYGSHQICQQILDIFNLKNKVYDKDTVSFISLMKKETLLRIKEFLYTDATIFMIRKKEKFDKIS